MRAGMIFSGAVGFIGSIGIFFGKPCVRFFPENALVAHDVLRKAFFALLGAYNPQCYPQLRSAREKADFNLQPARAALFS
jgi:hypothetical protein